MTPRSTILMLMMETVNTFVDAIALFCNSLAFVLLAVGSMSSASLYNLTASWYRPPLNAALPASFVLSNFCTNRRYLIAVLKSGSQLIASLKCFIAFSFSPSAYIALPLNTSASGSDLLRRRMDNAIFCASPRSFACPIFRCASPLNSFHFLGLSAPAPSSLSASFSACSAMLPVVPSRSASSAWAMYLSILSAPALSVALTEGRIRS